MKNQVCSRPERSFLSTCTVLGSVKSAEDSQTVRTSHPRTTGMTSGSDDYIAVVSHKQRQQPKENSSRKKIKKGKEEIDTDEHHEDGDKKHEQEGHVSKWRYMLKPMRTSSFFAPLTSIKTTGRLSAFLWGK